MPQDCVFCRIVRGELPAEVVHREDGLLAIRDINPVARTHVLVIPDRHIADLRELSAGDARGRFSVKFYMVAMLFILFDVEAVFVLPWAVIYRRLPAITGSRFFGFWEMLVYLGFVAVGLFYVWKKGILNWSNDKADL